MRSPRQADAAGSALPTSIYGFILRWSWRRQLALLALTALSLPVYYASLQLPKLIVNTLSGRDTPTSLFGREVGQQGYLLVLCGVFLALVLLNAGFGYAINLMKGRLGERLLRRLRFELFQHLLRFPLPALKRVSAGELIPMVTSEVEPLGGFVGDALALPAQQGGTLLTALLFLMVQAPVLGLAAAVVLPVQAVVIPRLQRRVNRLGKERVRAIRALGDRIGETVAAITEIHADNGARRHMAEFAERLGGLYEIRFEIYRRKFFVKFLNNFLNQLPPLFFFSAGGYLVLNGALSFASLVAVLAAYKDLAAPWKSLLDFYQAMEDSRIKYEQVIEQFQPTGLIDAEKLLTAPAVMPRLAGSVEFCGVPLDEAGPHGVDLVLPLDRHTAILGDAGSGKIELGLLLGRLAEPRAGRLLIAGADLASLPYGATGRRIGYVGAAAALFAGSLGDNLLAEIRRVPVVRDDEDPGIDAGGGTIDYDAAGVRHADGLRERLRQVLAMVEFDADLQQLGLLGRLESMAEAWRVLAAREKLGELLETEPSPLVERFDPERFNANLSVAENLLFGAPHDGAAPVEALAAAPSVRRVLERLGLVPDLVRIGRSIAATMVEILDDLSPGHPFFERFGLLAQDELPDWRRRLARAGRAAAGDRHAWLGLAFKLVEARHRLDLVDAPLRRRIVAARQALRRELPGNLRSRIDFFEPARYCAALPILDNLLFGRIAHGAADAWRRLDAAVARVVDSGALGPVLFEAALKSPVGSAGALLTPLQRQKVAIARAVLKRPDLLVLNLATQIFDPAAQTRILASLRAEFAGRALIAVLPRAEPAAEFDRVLTLARGRVVEHGDLAALDRPDSAFTMLRQAEAP
jgi:ABC-type multidrug transport system fused ATPase/permease subunit